MGVDIRTRRHADVHDLGVAEVFDGLLPDAADRHGELAARGLEVKGLPPMSLRAESRSLTLIARSGRLQVVPGEAAEATVAELDAASLSNLVQDRQTTMGLAMNSQVKIQQGEFAHWIAWEPVFRALFDGRRVHEAGDIVLQDEGGVPLDVHRSFELDDSLEEKAHFLSEAGFLHVRDVFDAGEMAAISADLDEALAAARADDGESWWAGDGTGHEQAVRVLWFHEKSEALAQLIRDDRLQWIADLTGDGHDGAHIGAEGLVKPLGIKTGLSDLPWHKDCGQGMHSYMCCGLTVGISVTGADRVSGALGVVPGSHRANCQTAGRDEGLDLQPIKLETRTGDITIHCGDTLHRAHPPTERPRKVVYTHFPLLLQQGDVVPKAPAREARAARANLTNVRDRIRASGGGAKA